MPTADELAKLREQLGIEAIHRELERILELLTEHRGSWRRRRRAYDDLILDEDDDEEDF